MWANMNVGTRIRERRRMLHLTLDAASARAGMQASNLSDIESGKRDVRTKTLARIAIALKCNPADFYDYAYEKDTEIAAGLRELLHDEKTMKLMSISEQEITWMRSIRFRPKQNPTKQDFIDLLFIYRNIN